MLNFGFWNIVTYVYSLIVLAGNPGNSVAQKLKFSVC